VSEITETIAVTREVTIAAAPETVWEFLVDPHKVALWLGESVELDARPGGAFRIGVARGHTARGEFVELDPPHRLVYTWGWEPGDDTVSSVPPGSSTIEFDLVAEGDATRVRFVHRDLPSPASAESHSQGWDHYLARLVIAGGGGDAGRDPWLDR
jgi:uncharacterized protein YndB with AHSA1/START domain